MVRTTITLSKEFREELEDLKLNDESMEEMLKRVIKGSKMSITQHHEPLAFTLEQYDEDSNKIDVINVFWSQLLLSDEDDVFDFNHKPHNCVNESATVLVCEDDYILVKFATEGYSNGNKTFKDYKFVCFNIFN